MVALGVVGMDAGKRTSLKPETPEYDRLFRSRDQAKVLLDFVRWLTSPEGPNVVVAQWINFDDGTPPKLFPVEPEWQRLFAEYYDIDIDQAEQERERLMAWLAVEPPYSDWDPNKSDDENARDVEEYYRRRFGKEGAG